MKEILILRLGKHHPLPKEIPLIHSICGHRLALAQGLPIPGVGVMTLLVTDWSPQEIAQAYKKLADETDDQLPTIVMEIGTAGLNLSDYPAFETALIATRDDMAATAPKVKVRKKQVTRCEMGLDDLLDLVSAKGVKGLSKEQRERLKELSKK